MIDLTRRSFVGMMAATGLAGCRTCCSDDECRRLGVCSWSFRMPLDQVADAFNFNDVSSDAHCLFNCILCRLNCHQRSFFQTFADNRQSPSVPSKILRPLPYHSRTSRPAIDPGYCLKGVGLYVAVSALFERRLAEKILRSSDRSRFLGIVPTVPLTAAGRFADNASKECLGNRMP